MWSAGFVELVLNIIPNPDIAVAISQSKEYGASNLEMHGPSDSVSLGVRRNCVH